MASSKGRQRRLARAKMERQMARRAAKVRRRRQAWAITVVSIVAVLGIAGTVWAVTSGKKKPSTTASACTWVDTGASNTNLKDVGKPPTTGIPKSGTDTMTITTSLGVITASVDLSKTPCTAASFTYLSGKNFFANSKCHRLVTTGAYYLQCGDPTGTGQGGPTYTYSAEYVPTTPAPTPTASPSPNPSASADTGADVIYPAGSIATANQAVNQNGSQFYIFYKDSPMPANYTLFGTVTSGLDIVSQVAAAGDDGSFANQGGGGKPKKDITIQTLIVAAAPSSSASAPAASSSATSTASPAASASSSAKS